VARRPGVLLAAAALALILAGGFQGFFLRFLTPKYAGMRPVFASLPFRKTPGLEDFMAGVKARTAVGDRIAFWAPYREWSRGYSFAFMRAAYVAGGRRLLPLVDETDQFLPRSLGESDWMASWNGEPEFPGFTPVWRHSYGILWRRDR
jgi:hypothetical protein